jgi:hypothetical protein
MSLMSESDGQEAVVARSATFRHKGLTILWGALFLALLAITGAVASRGGHYLWGAPLVLYALQAMAAEFMGLRVGADGVDVPRRLLGLVFWRERVALGDARAVIAKPRLLGFERATLKTATDQSLPLAFASRDDKLAFFDLLSRANPMISIYRLK